jgi:glycosyltransferase involved in cell wall biosynthesis
MKIVYLYTALTTVGGADRVITEKANYFSEKMGYDVSIITDSQGDVAPVFSLSPKVHLINLNIMFGQEYEHSFFLRGYYYFKLMREYKKRLENELNRIKPDFTISVLGRDADFLNKMTDGSLKIGEAHVVRPFMRNLHLMQKKSLPYRIVGKIWTKKLENVIRHLDAFVVLTESDAKNWESIRNSVVISNSLSFYDDRVSDYKSKKIISVGRYSEEKGFDLLIDAWYLIYKKHPEWKIYIYGEGVLGKSLQNQIDQLGLQQSILLERPVKNIQEKYLESSLYVLSSRFEGFGMVLIEAMACGLPCVAFNCPSGPVNIIKNSEDGLLVENGDIQELARNMSYMIANEEIRKDMGMKAKTNIKRYNTDVVMGKWVNLFESLIKSI